MCWISVGIFSCGCHVFGLTKDVLELGRLALALLEVTAEDDLLAILSFMVEWRRGDRCGEHANKRHWENVNHFASDQVKIGLFGRCTSQMNGLVKSGRYNSTKKSLAFMRVSERPVPL